YDEKKLKGKFKNNLKKTSFLDFPFVRNHHRFFIPLMPLASRFLKSDSEYDLVISSSAGYAKGFNIRGKLHISYCHTPLRYAWEKKYLEDLPLSLKLISKIFGNPILNYLKSWDKRAAEKVDFFIANSGFIKEKIKAYYGKEAEVIYPPVDERAFYEENGPRGDFYLMAGRLIYYKRFDLGIKACEHLKKKLKIAGTGPEEKKLRKSANPKFIEFAGNVRDNELRALYNRAKALIFPQVEDFGLVAAEAHMCGLPVIAYNEGGAREIVEDAKTGILFEKQTEKNLAEAIQKFENMNFDRSKIAASARRFSKQVFKDKMMSVIGRINRK
ncbi:MAG: glycosyltransferase, partial [Candidatus Wolfebacteria bacterium]|nr:glycosyltransferase [Candidatus Wolfebacteria bacterium]